MKNLLKLTLLMLALLLPATANAYDFEVDGIYYNITDGHACVTYNNSSSYNGSYSGEVTIPETVRWGNNTFTVSEIGVRAFSKCYDLYKINMPKTITVIGDYAFANCQEVTNFALPENIEIIGSHAFYNTRFAYVYFPASLRIIGESPFDGRWDACPDAEDYCWATYPYEYIVDSNNNYFSSEDGLLFNKEKTVLIDIPIAKSGTINIPNSVTECYDEFDFYSITRINVNIKTWYEMDFKYAPKYYYYTYDEDDNEVRHNLVYSNNTAIPYSGDITIPSNVTRIGSRVFKNNNSDYDYYPWMSVSIPNSVTEIGDAAFSNCRGLTSIDIPNSVASIGNSAFYNCSGLTSIIVDSGNPNYDSRNNCNAIIETATNTLIIGCKNTVIPNSVTNIGNYAFYNCRGLSSVTIPNSVTSIGNYAFYDCRGLNDVFSYIKNPSAVSMGNDVFYRYPNNYTERKLHVPFSTDSTYQSNNKWSQYFGSIVEMDPVLATSIELNETSAEITEGGTMQLTATVLPEDATDKTVTWVSSDESVATVDENGLVTAVSPGTATITATTNDGSELSASCAVTVLPNIVLATSMDLNQSNAEVNVGETVQLTATMLPEDATDKTVTWASSDESIAAVDENGLVTAVAPGTATITATTNDGSELSASCVVTVMNPVVPVVENAFLMPDTTVMHNDVIALPVAMTNNETITAFQTDIFLPEGFTIVTDEDDEYVVTPSGRMSSDHYIMTQDVSNGSVRVICYTPQSIPFSGNEGDLFYIHVQVPDDAEGLYTMSLRNTLLTTIDFQELSIADASCTIEAKQFIPGDVNDSRTVTVTDIVVAAQYVLEMNPTPFIFAAADMNGDGNITVTDIMLIANLVTHPTMHAPKRMPVLTDNCDRMIGKDITLASGEICTMSIELDNTLDYSAFQLDLTLPDGLTASNFSLTDRADGHALDVNTLTGRKTRVLCYSPSINMIDGHSGAVLTFDVTATADFVAGDISVDGIELVTTGCQTVLPGAFTIGVNHATGVNELSNGKAIARVDYYNLAGQRVERPGTGVTLVVTTYNDGTRSTAKLIK